MIYSHPLTDRTNYTRKRRKYHSLKELSFVQTTVEFYQEKNDLDSDPDFASVYNESSAFVLGEQQLENNNHNEKSTTPMKRKSIFRNIDESSAAIDGQENDVHEKVLIAKIKLFLKLIKIVFF